MPPILVGLLVMLAGLAITWGLGPASPGRAQPPGDGTGTRGGSLSLAAIESRVDPAIVDVSATLGSNAGETAGTGIVLTSTGEVLTNRHVIDGATSITAFDVGDGRRYSATVVGSDRAADVAVLQLSGASGLQTADIGDSSKVRIAEPVIALGNAGGAGSTPVAASGTVTALNQSIIASDTATGSRELLSGLIQSNADVQAGDSGGPLVTTGGQVIGMDSAASGSAQVRVGSNQMRGYSIPINRAVRLAEQMQARHAASTIHIETAAAVGIVVSSS